ncbi:MAG: hypothetical protein PHP51_07150, partial [Desulfotomaculaceae bacterium]|nr:hypothetical protein [Desulfotomaculaceae bacterium]
MKLHFIFRAFVTSLAVLSCFFLCVGDAGAASAGTVRVALVRNSDDLSFQVSGNYEIVDKATGRVVAVTHQGEKLPAELKGKRISLSGSRRDDGSFKGTLMVCEARYSAAVINSG